MSSTAALAVRFPDPPAAPIAPDLLATARALLARDRSPVLRVAPSTPPAMREAMLSALADEGIPHVARYAAAIRERVMRENRCASVVDCSRAVAQGLLDAVHDLAEYTPDPVDGLYDFFSRVPETLRPRRGAPRSTLTGRPRGAGDCDDLTVLAVSLVRAAGIRARPEWIDQPGAFLNHVSPIVYLPTTAHPSGEPAWAESTIEGARVGEHPYRVVERLGHGPRIFGVTP